MHPFQRQENGLILIVAKIDSKYRLKLILDTGATHTTIDKKTIYLCGYRPNNILSHSKVETANGLIEVDNFEANNLFALGISKDNFKIQAYDFAEHGIYSDYNGVLGLDFLENVKFCIDTKFNLITLHTT